MTGWAGGRELRRCVLEKNFIFFVASVVFLPYNPRPFSVVVLNLGDLAAHFVVIQGIFDGASATARIAQMARATDL